MQSCDVRSIPWGYQAWYFHWKTSWKQDHAILGINIITHLKSLKSSYTTSFHRNSCIIPPISNECPETRRKICVVVICVVSIHVFFFKVFRFLLTFGESSQFGEARSITEIINKLSCMILYAAARIWKALHVISKSPFLRPRTSCHRDSLGTEDWKVGHPSFKKKPLQINPKKEKDMSSKGKGHIIIQTIHFLVQPFVFTKKSQQVFISWGSDPSTAEGPQQHRWQGHLLLKSGQMSAPYRVRNPDTRIQEKPPKHMNTFEVCVQSSFLDKEFHSTSLVFIMTVQGGGPSEDWVAEVLEGTARFKQWTQCGCYKESQPDDIQLYSLLCKGRHTVKIC